MTPAPDTHSQARAGRRGRSSPQRKADPHTMKLIQTKQARNASYIRKHDAITAANLAALQARKALAKKAGK